MFRRDSSREKIKLETEGDFFVPIDNKWDWPKYVLVLSSIHRLQSSLHPSIPKSCTFENRAPLQLSTPTLQKSRCSIRLNECKQLDAICSSNVHLLFLAQLFIIFSSRDRRLLLHLGNVYGALSSSMFMTSLGACIYVMSKVFFAKNYISLLSYNPFDPIYCSNSAQAVPK